MNGHRKKALGLPYSRLHTYAQRKVLLHVSAFDPLLSELHIQDKGLRHVGVSGLLTPNMYKDLGVFLALPRVQSPARPHDQAAAWLILHSVINLVEHLRLDFMKDLKYDVWLSGIDKSTRAKKAEVEHARAILN